MRTIPCYPIKGTLYTVDYLADGKIKVMEFILIGEWVEYVDGRYLQFNLG